MKCEKLLLDHRLEVEEYRPAACVSYQVRCQATIEALDRMLPGEELFEDAESVYWSFGGAAVD